MQRRVLINGIAFDVLEETSRGKLLVKRPKGMTEYVAYRLPDSDLYGENRAAIDRFETWLKTRMTPRA